MNGGLGLVAPRSYELGETKWQMPSALSLTSRNCRHQAGCDRSAAIMNATCNLVKAGHLVRPVLSRLIAAVGALVGVSFRFRH
jgi:hypothetical protein